MLVPYVTCFRCSYNGPQIGDTSIDVDGILCILCTTDVVLERNTAAFDLLEVAPRDVIPELIAALLTLLQQPRTRDHRQPLIHVLNAIPAVLSPAVLTDLLLDNNGDAFDEALNLIESELFVHDEASIAEQIVRIERYLLDYRADDPMKYLGMRQAHFIFVLSIAKPFQLASDVKLPFEPWSIAILNVVVTTLAQQLNYRLDHWGDDPGFAVILPTGLWVLLRETTDFYSPRCTLVELIIEPVDHVDLLLNEVLEWLGLSGELVKTKRIRSTDCWT